MPESLAQLVQTGLRVEVPFGKNKHYSGIVERLHRETPPYPVKPVLAVLDQISILSPKQLQLWDWIADYYCCTLGEVMQAAMPSHLKLSSETRLVFNEEYGDNFSALDAEEYLIAEGLLLRKEITVDDARLILNKKTIFPVVQRLLNHGVLLLREELQERFRPKMVSAVRLAAPYNEQPELLREVMTQLAKKERQLEILMAYLTLSKRQPLVLKQELLQKADVTEASLKTLVKKEIFEIYAKPVSRLGGFEDAISDLDALSAQQTRALEEVRSAFAEKKPTLLFGVTGSGKTRVYIELIREVIQRGGQALYLLPEIALTGQITQRLQKAFGGGLAVYHSKIGTNERVEVWKAASGEGKLFLAARSGLFLPFRNLQLLIVDEEHDSSFKQYDPAPRYHARDTAVYLSQLHQAPVLLGTATPSIESWYNATTGKYALVEMPERFGGMEMPEIDTIDLKTQLKTKQMHGIFAAPLLDTLKETLARKEQAILFQNRRGFAPMLECQVCGWNAMCKNCDVSLTYHKGVNKLRCHYCGYQQDPLTACPACGSGKIGLKGFGTEKIEDEIKLFLPEARIGRMDLDTAGAKSTLAALLNDFEERRLDILVGTQMVTKGLDFDNVAVVGVLGADQLTKFPDFRAGERAFQLLTQVAGRAGRKHKRGRVLIQAFDHKHPVLLEVLSNDFRGFATRELRERRQFNYPPFQRLIHLSVRHKDPKITHAAAAFLGKALRRRLGDRVLGPVLPQIPRIRNYFAQDILLKLEKSVTLIPAAKQLIREQTEVLLGQQGWSQVQVVVDVDPM